MEWASLALQLAMRLGMVIIEAVSRGDDTVLDARVGDLLGAEMRTTIAREIAEARARAKFGAP